MKVLTIDKYFTFPKIYISIYRLYSFSCFFLFSFFSFYFCVRRRNIMQLIIITNHYSLIICYLPIHLYFFHVSSLPFSLFSVSGVVLFQHPEGKSESADFMLTMTKWNVCHLKFLHIFFTICKNTAKHAGDKVMYLQQRGFSSTEPRRRLPITLASCGRSS